MKFTLKDGDPISARQAWHDSFVTGVSAIDARDAINNHNVQFSAKGSDGCTMDHCDKGKIQQVIFKISVSHPVAHAWGMIAYAPEGIENTTKLRNILFPYIMDSISNDKFNAFQSPIAGRIAFIAIQDAAVEARTNQRTKRRWTEMSSALGVTPTEYEKVWLNRFIKAKDALKDLDAICLPPVAHLVHLLVKKAESGPSELLDIVEDIARFIKTPLGAA